MAQRDAMQCAGPRPYAFVVHGLWPQFEQGFPRTCPSREAAPGRALTDTLLDIMPSRRLVHIQWERHGTCSGLPADAYFATTRAARARISIPPAFEGPDRWQQLTARQIEDAFLSANPGLSRNAIAVEGRGQRLRDVRICLDTRLAFRACPEVDADGLADRQQLRIPPVRGN